MGWTGLPINSRLNTTEINQIIDDALWSPDYRIIDRSGWNGWDHQHLLAELNPDVKPEEPARRLIIVALARQSKNELRYKIMDETEGPNQIDCPLRILDAADLYPPGGGYAAQWREQCRQHHTEVRQINGILKAIEENPRYADRRLMLRSGKVVHYRKVRQKQRNVKAYHEAGDHQLYFLKLDNVDVPRTLALREQNTATVA